jgi:Phospholipid methyltransferase
VLLDSFARFALQGLGTPAPISPTRHLVVTGLYRHVRNPMYVSVVSLIVGQGLLFGNLRVLEYGFAVWLAFHLFVLLYEEPTLRSTFGAGYEAFCANVPRWIPRLRPWQGNRTTTVSLVGLSLEPKALHGLPPRYSPGSPRACWGLWFEEEGGAPYT